MPNSSSAMMFSVEVDRGNCHTKIQAKPVA
jgi:hypothetical protein